HARPGDPESMQERVKRNPRFVASVAQHSQNRGMPPTDGTGEGYARSPTAARKADPDQGGDCIPCAACCIPQAPPAARARQRRDAKVLRLYFGVDGGREHTLEEVGGMLGATRERGRQLRDRALKRLRGGDVGKALASFAA